MCKLSYAKIKCTNYPTGEMFAIDQACRWIYCGWCPTNILRLCFVSTASRLDDDSWRRRQKLLTTSRRL